MKKILFTCLLLAAGCDGGGDTINDYRTFNCSADINTEAISLDDFEQRVSEGENLQATSSFEANGEQFVVVNVCTDNTGNEDTDSNSSVNTVNGLL